MPVLWISGFWSGLGEELNLNLYHLSTTSQMGLLQKIVKNDAMKEDPPEIYGWKVYFLAFSVRYMLCACIESCLTVIGMLRWYAVWCRFRYHRRCSHSTRIQDVSVHSYFDRKYAEILTPSVANMVSMASRLFRELICKQTSYQPSSADALPVLLSHRMLPIDWVDVWHFLLPL